MLALVVFAIARRRNAKSHVRPLDLRFRNDHWRPSMTLHPLDAAIVTLGQSNERLNDFEEV